jgi:hypothetical protein
VLLVTCSRDESRRDLAIEVMRNLAEVVPAAGLSDRLVVYDNGSTFAEHLALAPHGAVVCRSATNDGYWSAIKWVLDNRRDLLGRDFDYLYIVESDLTHSSLVPLGECERFLAQELRASCVRTQEFSVRWRLRFNKRLKMLPFYVERSAIALSNATSGEKAWFQPVDGFPGIFLSNLHAKLPALNRLRSLDAVFARLAQAQEFTEGDFFREMMKEHPLIGVLDGGLFHSIVSYSDRKTSVMASYTAADKLAGLGYKGTRTARIVPVNGQVSIERR